MAKKGTTRRVPSKTSEDERVLRKEKKFSPTWRVYWLLTAMSHLKGYTYMSEAEMAKQIGTTERQIQNSLEIIERIASEYFRKEKPQGIHRANQWHRVKPPGEKPEEFVRRAQAHPEMDVCMGLHWIAIDQGKDTGIAEFSARGIWPVTDEALRQARRKMNGLAYFTVDSARERGKPAIYIRIDQRFADAKIEQKVTKPVENIKPTQTGSRVESETINISAATVGDNEERIRVAELERKQRLAFEMGIDLEGKPRPGLTAKSMGASLPKKKVVIPHGLVSGRRKDLVEEP
jgi:hypothetical protein